MRNHPTRGALITGGARGIGAAIAKKLANEGIGVVIGDVLDEEGQATAESLGNAGRYCHLDVTSDEDWSTAIALAEQEFGQLSTLVNNAGILSFGLIQDQAAEDFRRVLDINLYGAWLGMHYAAPSLIRSHAGVVVNISSTAGLLGYSGIGAYVASKWGLRGLTKTAALELSTGGVRVCSVHPGPIATPMTAGIDPATVMEQPIPRFGRPEEVAAMVRFIVCEASFSTGCEFIVDGGATAGLVVTEISSTVSEE